MITILNQELNLIADEQEMVRIRDEIDYWGDGTEQEVTYEYDTDKQCGGDWCQEVAFMRFFKRQAAVIQKWWAVQKARCMNKLSYTHQAPYNSTQMKIVGHRHDIIIDTPSIRIKAALSKIIFKKK